MSAHLLIIEDDPALGAMLTLEFEDLGYRTTLASDGQAGLESLARKGVDLVLLDQQLPDGLGIDLLPQILEPDPDLPVVMMTGRHDLELAIRAIREGAEDFVHKPVQVRELDAMLGRILEGRRQRRRQLALEPAAPPEALERDLIGRSAAMLEVSKAIARCAESHANVLITGESGTGKEVVARLIHHHSGLPGPLVAVNVAAIVDTLIESELFGHEKGAFTGAAGRKLGRFEQARDGTLFLDEIGELALPLQAKLLRVLQEGSFERVGGIQTLPANARIIAATHRDLEAEAAAGRFREDLWFRLNVVNIRLPALRERPEDIPLLVDALMARIGPQIHKPPLKPTEAALQRLQQCPWPGNVRELENVLTRAMVHAADGLLTADLLPAPDGPASADQGLAEESVHRTLEQVEAAQVRRVYRHTQGHKGKTCEILGISRPALERKLKKYAIEAG